MKDMHERSITKEVLVQLGIKMPGQQGGRRVSFWPSEKYEPIKKTGAAVKRPLFGGRDRQALTLTAPANK